MVKNILRWHVKQWLCLSGLNCFASIRLRVVCGLRFLICFIGLGFCSLGTYAANVSFLQLTGIDSVYLKHLTLYWVETTFPDPRVGFLAYESPDSVGVQLSTVSAESDLMKIISAQKWLQWRKGSLVDGVLTLRAVSYQRIDLNHVPVEPVQNWEDWLPIWPATAEKTGVYQEREPNNTPFYANRLERTQGQLTLLGTIQNRNDADFFSITVDPDQPSVEVSIRWRAKGVLAPKIRVWDENFSVIGSWIPPFKQARFSVRLPLSSVASSSILYLAVMDKIGSIPMEPGRIEPLLYSISVK